MKKILVAMGGFFACLCSNQALYAQGQTPQPNLTVLLNNHMRLVPLRDLGDRNIAYMGHLTIPAFATLGDMLERYAPVSHFMVPDNVDTYHDLDEQLKYYNTLIVGLAATDLADRRLLQFIATQAVSKQLILTVFGTGTGLQALDFVHYP